MNSLRKLRVKLDKLQDTTDRSHGSHVTIPITASMLAELIHQVEIESVKRREVE